MGDILNIRVGLAYALLLIGVGVLNSAAHAHHSNQVEYGPFNLPTVYVEGVILEMHWGNPHIFFDITITGGDIEANEYWRLESHPVGAMTGYSFARDDFVVGDTIKIIGWKSVRGAQTILLRAIQVSEGPMRSSLRYRDMIDIADGSFDELNIAPAQNLDGAPPEAAGTDTVHRLHEMGLLDENGFFIWPGPP